MKSKLLSVVFACGVTLTLGGCLIARSTSVYETGQRVTEHTKHQITIGETTDEWLLATLGEPTDRQTVEDQPNTEIWRYTYKKREESGGAVFLLFAGSSSKSTSTTTYFEVTDGVVTKYWSE